MLRPLYFITLLLVCVAIYYAQDVELDVQMGTEETAQFFPLLRFASIGDLDSVIDEIKQGKDVNEQMENGVTAVHAAARYNHNEILHALIQAGANLNVRETDGWTPLMFAAYNGNMEGIRLIIAGNADPLMSNANGYGAHSLAYFNNFREAAEYIATAGLKRAIENVDMKSAQVMIQDGAPVNTQTTTGATALMAAAHVGDAESVNWLLSHPAIHPDFQEADGWTAIMFATYFNHVPIVRLLLDKGVDLNVRNVRGQSVLDLALLHQRTEVQVVLHERLALIEAHEQQRQADALSAGLAAKFPNAQAAGANIQAAPAGTVPEGGIRVTEAAAEGAAAATAASGAAAAGSGEDKAAAKGAWKLW